MTTNTLVEIPAKSTFKLNEVCQITGVKPYVLKFWEEQFESVKPMFSASGKKLFEHSDIQAIALIKKLLFEEKLSIDEAKKEIHLRFTANEKDNIEPVKHADELEIERQCEVKVQSQVKTEESSLVAPLVEKGEAMRVELIEFNKSETVKESEKILPNVIKKESFTSHTEHKTAHNDKSFEIQKETKKYEMCPKDKQKLVLAKAKLQNMIMLTGQMQAREGLH